MICTPVPLLKIVPAQEGWNIAPSGDDTTSNTGVRFPCSGVAFTVKMLVLVAISDLLVLVAGNFIINRNVLLVAGNIKVNSSLFYVVAEKSLCSATSLLLLE
jgi:hypothetical protein